MAVAYVSHVDPLTRWKESACSETFARFVAEELVPWLHSHFQQAVGPLPTILGGLSLTGLAAAHAVLLHPHRFSGVLCQSASLWWSDQWLIHAYRTQKPPPLRFRICCGNRETTEYVEHGPEMIQRSSQLAANRAMRDVLVDRGCELSYEEFAGGHDIELLAGRSAPIAGGTPRAGKPHGLSSLKEMLSGPNRSASRGDYYTAAARAASTLRRCGPIATRSLRFAATLCPVQGWSERFADSSTDSWQPIFDAVDHLDNIDCIRLGPASRSLQIARRLARNRLLVGGSDPCVHLADRSFGPNRAVVGRQLVGQPSGRPPLGRRADLLRDQRLLYRLRCRCAPQAPATSAPVFCQPATPNLLPIFCGGSTHRRIGLPV